MRSAHEIGPRHRKSAVIAIIVAAVLTFGLTQYFSCRYDNRPEFSAAQTLEGPSASADIPRVEFCELLRNPFAYEGQVIRIESTLGRFRDNVTFYDPGCVPRHPLVSVLFSPSLEYETQSEAGEKLRQIMKGSNEANEGDVHLFVSAVGTFEPIPRERRRDFTELQYEFTVTRIVEAK